MKILIVAPGKLPAMLYGGTQRVAWALGKALIELGHQVSFLANKGSSCDFAPMLIIDEKKTITQQIPPDFDVVHFHFHVEHPEEIGIPYIFTAHGTMDHCNDLDKNTIFISKNHAERHNSSCYVYNGLDWDMYSKPNLKQKRKDFHFLAKAAWRIKNVKGAIDIIKETPREKLHVLGGVRFNIKMGIRFTFSPKIHFHGMVGGTKKDHLLNASKGLIFPVRCHEAFGLAVIESLYFGCPVFATPYGSLSELITSEVGVLSHKKEVLKQAIQETDSYSKIHCHEYVRENFNAQAMARGYLNKYEQVIRGEALNEEPPRLLELPKTKFLPWE